MNNPMAIVQNLMSNAMVRKNPIVANAFGMAQRGDVEGLTKLANNVCKERGTTPDEIMKQLCGRIL